MEGIHVLLEFISATLVWVCIFIFRVGSKLDNLTDVLEEIRDLKEREEMRNEYHRTK